MKRILLVDDEPGVLDDLRGKLAAARAPWELASATSGAEALELLERESFDVVVCDAGMPGMDGGELLASVRQLRPSVVRLLMASEAERELAQRSADQAHQSLLKDAPPEALRAALARGIALQDVLTNDRLRYLVDRLDRLPSVPSLYFEFVEAMKRPDATVEGLGHVIAKDLGMTSKVLQIVNSSMFGLREKISSPGQAATFIGLDSLRSLVLSVGVFAQYSEHELEHLSVEETWAHGLEVAGFTRTILRCEHADDRAVEEGFLAGMLHDVGALVLASNRPQRFHATEVFSNRGFADRAELERRLFGASHAALGAWLLGRWGMPTGAVEAVLHHHAPSAPGETEFSVATAVHVANVLTHTDLDDERSVLVGLDRDHLAYLGLARRLPRWIEACRASRVSLEPV